MIYHIYKNVYLSNLHSARQLSEIQKNNITRVFRLSEDFDSNYIYPPDIEFVKYELEDNLLYTGELLEYSSDINKRLIQSSVNTLIHCNEGQSRSVAIIILFLIHEVGMTYLDAYDLIKKIKTDIRPNSGFHRVIKLYDEIHKNTTNPNDLDTQLADLTAFEYSKYKLLKN